jgi:hypothetical protein
MNTSVDVSKFKTPPSFNLLKRWIQLKLVLGYLDGSLAAPTTKVFEYAKLNRGLKNRCNFILCPPTPLKRERKHCFAGVCLSGCQSTNSFRSFSPTRLHIFNFCKYWNEIWYTNLSCEYLGYILGTIEKCLTQYCPLDFENFQLFAVSLHFSLAVCAYWKEI